MLASVEAMAAPPEAPRRRRLRGGALALIAAAVGAALT